MSPPKVPVVAIFNSNDDVVEMLRTAFEAAGLVVVSAHVDEIRRGRTSLVEFIREHDPDVIVYDLVPPYDRSVRFLQHLQNQAFAGRRFVLTSANRRRAREVCNTPDEVYEFIGKPYDLDEITRVVSHAARGGAAAFDDGSPEPA
jgi:DNA-binding NtrC family response regulator